MIEKFNKLILIFLFLSSCGYTTIYSKNNQNINVEVLSFSGDKRINYRLIQKLEKKRLLGRSRMRKQIGMCSVCNWVSTPQHRGVEDKERSLCIRS